jgi:hypothetical protein
LPSGQPGVNAGPAFAMSRHTHLPATPHIARQVYTERLQQLVRHGERLLDSEDALPLSARPQLVSAVANLKRVAELIFPT